MSEIPHFDLIVIGCGIAGASLAYFLASRGMTDILILEREDQPGFHATGRSAAALVEFDLIPSTLHLKLMGARFLRNPPPGFSDNPLLDKSGILITFKGLLWDRALAMVPGLKASGVTVEVLSREETLKRVPVLVPGNFDGAILLPEDGHIDVNELLWGYIRHARRLGARLQCGEEVVGIRTHAGRCTGVVTTAGEYRSSRVVNAAGAWAGRMREMASPVAGVIELTPYRRTIVTFPAPEGLSVDEWPHVGDLSNDLYFSPESSGLFASPMDEDPTEPCNARPDQMVVAETMERLKRVAPRLVPGTITHSWAGLRTFAPDRGMVVGEDPVLTGFFWLAGQGGSGIETSPAVGRIAADLIVEGTTDKIDPRTLSPARFLECE